MSSMVRGNASILAATLTFGSRTLCSFLCRAGPQQHARPLLLNNGGSCPASLELLKHAEPQTRIARRVQADGVEWSQVS